jgi:hypothetical protein
VRNLSYHGRTGWNGSRRAIVQDCARLCKKKKLSPHNGQKKPANRSNDARRRLPTNKGREPTVAATLRRSRPKATTSRRKNRHGRDTGIARAEAGRRLPACACGASGKGVPGTQRGRRAGPLEGAKDGRARRRPGNGRRSAPGVVSAAFTAGNLSLHGDICKYYFHLFTYA